MGRSCLVQSLTKLGWKRRSALPHGKRPKGGADMAWTLILQSTPPAREATRRAARELYITPISIHASRAGGDGENSQRIIVCFSCFQQVLTFSFLNCKIITFICLFSDRSLIYPSKTSRWILLQRSKSSKTRTRRLFPIVLAISTKSRKFIDIYFI